MCMWLLVISLIPIQAFGHAKLIQTEPLADSQLEQAPEHLHLLFNQRLEGINHESLIVKDDLGNTVDTGHAEIGSEGNSIQVTLPVLNKGTYSVHYDVLSLDGHVVKGNYAFTVLAGGMETKEP